MKDSKVEWVVESKALARKMTELEEYTGMTFQMVSSMDGSDYMVQFVDSRGCVIALHPRDDVQSTQFYIAMLYLAHGGSRTFQENLENMVDDIYFKLGETEKSVRMKLELRGTRP